ncbi:hypothetical protein HPB51_016223 [Rhipicephalus microplus]|uniref:THAP-type domain-containing protein n=1 Tax=Rhipicephalus microplus TaxID=6941 RepID=A0A9J6E9W4_RHIMP|nr:hypothetical protein HPB51_016223 [Rhipicephalus microplus]
MYPEQGLDYETHRLRAKRFPKDKTLRDAWQRAVRRDGWEPKNADVLCSEHFEANCFDRTGQTTRLRPESIPTIFPAFPAHLQKPAKRKREAPKCRTALSPVVSAEAAVEMPSEPSSPAKDWYRSKAEESAQEVLQLKKKVKTLQQSKRRLSKRCDASENLIKELKERKLLSEKGLEVFEATFSPEIQQLLVRAHEKTNKMYPPELRAFALTLHYYSAAAYEYVRSKFNNALPSQRTLPKSQDKPLIAALMMDDMAIKKHVQLVGKKVPPDDDNDCTQRVDFPTSLSPVVGAVVPYIAGFVARKVYGGTSCDECCSALLSSELPPLTAVKTNGGLVAPSKDVLKICHTVEKGLRALQVQCKDLKSLHANSDRLMVEVLTEGV